MARRITALLAASALVTALALPAGVDAKAPTLYRVTPLVADQPGMAAHTDANLINGWGLVAGPTTPWWVANNGTDTSTLYDGSGAARALVVSVPGGPTGAVFNGTSGFVVSSGATSGPARFLFATEGGQVLGWNPGVPASSTLAQVGADRSGVGAIYKGLAIAASGAASYLYATDFHNGRVDVFNSAFALQSWSGAFMDPMLPAGYAPFGIQQLGGQLFVTFAKQDAAAKDEVDGEGLGVVDAFGTDGSFHGRVATGGSLNAPWGLAWAPAGFGRFAGDLLVGNFGDGRIHGYRWGDDGWEDQGPLRGLDHRPISIDGLWGIGFGNGTASGPTTTLYFASGPDGEAHGLFGSIAAG